MSKLQITRNRLEDEIANALREVVVTGGIAPGERLIEADLAKKFGVSRAPLREAMKALVAQGLLVSVPRKGTFVVELSKQDIWEICTLRLALERTAAEILVDTITAEQIQELNTLIDELKIALDEGTRWKVADLDLHLHLTIVRFCGHSRLYKAMSNIADQLRSFFAAADGLIEDHQVTERHRTLVAALSSGNKEKAVATITEHVSHSADLLLEAKSSLKNHSNKVESK